MRRTCAWIVLASAWSLTLPARGDARARKTEAILQASARDLSHGNAVGAERRLRGALTGRAPDARILLAYARLVVPLVTAPAPEPPRLAQLEQRAQSLLMRLERAAPIDDAETERQLRLHAAWAAALLGRYETALSAVREAARLQDPATLACLRLIAVVTARRERLQLAEQALHMARQYVPQDSATMSELAHVLLAEGRPDLAVNELAERLAIAPAALDVRRDLAYALTAAGRGTEGLSLLLGVRADCERAPACALEAARIALEAGQPDEAVRFAERRLERLPDDLDALYVGADGHAQRGRFAEARALWSRVLRVSPDSVRARQALAELPATSNTPP